VIPILPVAGVIYGPFSVARQCSTSKPTEWFAELEARWLISKGEATGELGGVEEEGPVLDSCGI
jgi:hypothetical protein